MVKENFFGKIITKFFPEDKTAEVGFLLDVIRVIVGVLFFTLVFNGEEYPVWKSIGCAMLLGPFATATIVAFLGSALNISLTKDLYKFILGTFIPIPFTLLWILAKR